MERSISNSTTWWPLQIQCERDGGWLNIDAEAHTHPGPTSPPTRLQFIEPRQSPTNISTTQQEVESPATTGFSCRSRRRLSSSSGKTIAGDMLFQSRWRALGRSIGALHPSFSRKFSAPWLIPSGRRPTADQRLLRRHRLQRGSRSMSHDLYPRWPRQFSQGHRPMFQRHDGHAVTTDNFVQAMQDAERGIENLDAGLDRMDRRHTPSRRQGPL